MRGPDNALGRAAPSRMAQIKARVIADASTQLEPEARIRALARNSERLPENRPAEAVRIGCFASQRLPENRPAEAVRIGCFASRIRHLGVFLGGGAEAISGK